MQSRNGDDVKYFFIVSQYSRGRMVINIRKGVKGGVLEIVKPERGRESQLWRWDENCRLVSKLGLVADIKGRLVSKLGLVADIKDQVVSKLGIEAEEVCHAWKAHNGLSQKWRVEKAAIVSNSSHLVIDGSPPTAQVFMRKFKEDSEHQKWHFVPEEAWDDFQLSLTDPNPLKKALFWKNVAGNYLDVIIGYSFNEYQTKVYKVFEDIDECISRLEEVAKGTGIAQTVGGSVAVAGGGAAIAGLLLAPVTAGVSLALTVGGTIGSLTGKVTSLTAKLVDCHLDREKRKNVHEGIGSLHCATCSFHSLLSEYGKCLQQANEYLDKQEHEQISFHEKSMAAEKCALLGEAFETLEFVKKIYHHAKEIKRLVMFMEANSFVCDGADVGISTIAAAPDFTIPIVGDTLLTAGTTGAEVLSESFFGYGLWTSMKDIYYGGKQIANYGEFRQFSKILREKAHRLIRLYKELKVESME